MSRVVSKGPCPKCPSSDACMSYDDGHSFCFSCNYYNPGNGRELELDTFTYEYIPLRGLTKQTLEFYDVRTRIDAAGRPIALCFPYSGGGEGTPRAKVRDLTTDEKVFRWEPAGPSGSVGLFGQSLFTPGGHKYVTITEGEIDALSLHQVLGGPVVSVQSSVTARRDCSIARQWLNSYERIYLAFDNDTNGRDATDAVAGLFDPDKVYDVKFTSRKDANEYLQAGEVQELKNIWWNAKKYLPEDIISSLSDFHTELSQLPVMGVPYPFKKLTEMTYGIRPGEIVLITAQEKVGKTEFMHFLLHNLLKETDDAIAGLFIEEPRKRTLEALVGIELGKPVHLPDSGVSEAQRIETIDRLVGRDDRLHLYTHSRSADPGVLLDRVRFLAAGRACKYVLFDHPGMAVFGIGGDNERLLLDQIAVRTALMVKELNFALIVVSHVNDFGQTRGSRYLGKVCDLRIDLTRDTANPDETIRNTINVTIPYGRYCSNSGPVGSYLFDPGTQRYTEVANDNNPYTAALREAA